MQLYVGLGLPLYLLSQSSIHQALKISYKCLRNVQFYPEDPVKKNDIKARQEPSDLAVWKVGEADDTILLPASISAEIHLVRDTQPVCRILKEIDTVTL